MLYVIYIILSVHEKIQEIPVWLRPHIYKAWARAFHSSMIDFFVTLTFSSFYCVCSYNHHLMKLTKFVHDKL